jgi:hypothetical protein
MLRITRTRQFRVSNRMAVMAALLLVITAATGLSNPFEAPDAAAPATMAETNRTAPGSETPAERTGSAAVKKRKFKVSLYLFRRN